MGGTISGGPRIPRVTADAVILHMRERGLHSHLAVMSAIAWCFSKVRRKKEGGQSR